MPAKRLPHLLGFLASFKNHSSSRHHHHHHQNPIQLARPKFRQWHKLCQKPFASNGIEWVGGLGFWVWVFGLGLWAPPSVKRLFGLRIHFYVFAHPKRPKAIPSPPQPWGNFDA